MHTCDEYCWSRALGTGPLTQDAGRQVEPHRAVRPGDYPDSDALSAGAPWPKEPPYCATCGHEMLTMADVAPDLSDLEQHADNGLEAQP